MLSRTSRFFRSDELTLFFAILALATTATANDDQNNNQQDQEHDSSQQQVEHEWLQLLPPHKISYEINVINTNTFDNILSNQHLTINFDLALITGANRIGGHTTVRSLCARIGIQHQEIGRQIVRTVATRQIRNSFVAVNVLHRPRELHRARRIAVGHTNERVLVVDLLACDRAVRFVWSSRLSLVR